MHRKQSFPKRRRSERRDSLRHLFDQSRPASGLPSIEKKAPLHAGALSFIESENSLIISAEQGGPSAQTRQVSAANLAEVLRQEVVAAGQVVDARLLVPLGGEVDSRVAATRAAS